MSKLLNYVKFQRGTPTAYAALRNKDEDTLYFVSNPSDNFGILYLGERIIGGSSSGTEAAYSNLAQLKDIDLSGLEDGFILVYSADRKKWIAKKLESQSGNITQKDLEEILKNYALSTTVGDLSKLVQQNTAKINELSTTVGNLAELLEKTSQMEDRVTDLETRLSWDEIK